MLKNLKRLLFVISWLQASAKRFINEIYLLEYFHCTMLELNTKKNIHLSENCTFLAQISIAMH
jgi:hypothetical protein